MRGPVTWDRLLLTFCDICALACCHATGQSMGFFATTAPFPFDPCSGNLSTAPVLYILAAIARGYDCSICPGIFGLPAFTSHCGLSRGCIQYSTRGTLHASPSLEYSRFQVARLNRLEPEARDVACRSLITLSMFRPLGRHVLQMPFSIWSVQSHPQYYIVALPVWWISNYQRVVPTLRAKMPEPQLRA
ncbi:hypothetical protein BV22DRAFT_452470 [Leucogyrophana mollusca]|uniref:Uncharacterized protein n=1 Tax=Leucogyrophana mollusca TaxID=85980 RepID=A0ACB8BJ62_9AGAM|nr:hypothetical protein BV22DRAFT_452470 [Leucogyrophana mollusca]